MLNLRTLENLKTSRDDDNYTRFIDKKSKL